MKTHAFRLVPRDDLRAGIDSFVIANNIQAGVILTCIGNLQKAVLRMADEHIIKTYEGSHEILSLSGTVEAGNSHLHISISDAEGTVFGGHLKMGSIVGITAEIVIGELENTVFKRELDERTDFEELVVE